MSLIASAIPGRLRLRHLSLRNSTRLEHLRETIAGWPHIQSVSSNPRAGSLLVHYDQQVLDPAGFAQRCEQAAGQWLPSPRKTPQDHQAPRPGARSGSRRVRANRLAKRSMLATLAVSMLLAAAGNKRWHALSGVMFLHALAIHLWVHRRHLLN